MFNVGEVPILRSFDTDTDLPIVYANFLPIQAIVSADDRNFVPMKRYKSKKLAFWTDEAIVAL
jgi:hypothetical protein